ncbi:PH domain-containing protein [Thioalkalivibrio sp. ALMg11]|uniref:PH domain-containing protein n=1 Tax=Thioalkalivibrio sp. ALMg11 TaxID=1158165 RepID=UPI00037FA932|nr:PH domain-containing protein [Thioalkalivibrio sp. ALMg11]
MENQDTQTNQAIIEARPAWRNQWMSLAALPFVAAVPVWVTAWYTLPGLSLPLPPPQGLFAAIASASIPSLLVASWGALGFLILRVLYLRYVDHFRLDENRVAHRHGIVARNQHSIRLAAIRSVELKQSIMQRILGIGDILIYAAGSNEAEVAMKGLSRPLKAQESIKAASEAASTRQAVESD